MKIESIERRSYSTSTERHYYLVKALTDHDEFVHTTSSFDNKTWSLGPCLSFEEITEEKEKELLEMAVDYIENHSKWRLEYLFIERSEKV
ncbi:hypothetical protein ACFQ4X_06945 [Fictibacillus halophilus]|uniref:hypothetical protein n=1 Tax=Fictibacillus halophilus TaxID=1610490 RepID=UPI0036393DFD